MSIPTAIRRILDSKGITYDVLLHSPGQSPRNAVDSLRIDPGHVAVAALLKDDAGILMAVYAVSRSLDLSQFNREMRRSFVPMSVQEVREHFPQCRDGTCAPLAEIYGLEAVVDEGLASANVVYVPVAPGTLIRVSGWHFSLLQGPAWYDRSFARDTRQTAQRASVTSPVGRAARRARIRAHLQSVEALPAMPGIAHEILRLSVNPYANATDLAAVIERDPSLCAQLIRYANSPFYNYRGDVDSVRDAISRVLGFDLVMDIALGIAVGKAFRIPRGGPLGLDAFWRHATYAAVLVQRLGSLLASTYRPRPGTAYLAGLLHNFGFLVLGHLFPEDFKLLNAAVTEHPDTPIAELESIVLGVAHQEIGAWLMEAWGIPDEVLVAIREHHNEGYRGSHSEFANLILIGNRLLKTLGLGDEASAELPTPTLWALGLAEDEVLGAFDNVMQNRNGLDFMALQMAA